MNSRALPALLAVLLTLGAVSGCSGTEQDATAPERQDVAAEAPDSEPMEAEEEQVEPTQRPLPPMDENNILNIAINSPDHSTLVAAVQAADLTTAVAATGPLTLFAPTDAAFEALPPGTVEELMQPENKATLANILKYHVAAAVYNIDDLSDGQELGMANMDKVTFTVADDGNLLVNDAMIVNTIRGSNGIIHVIDGVLLPPE